MLGARRDDAAAMAGHAGEVSGSGNQQRDAAVPSPAGSAAGDPRVGEVSRGQAPPPGRWRALAVTQIAAFMVLLDVSIVNVALPSIERGLGVSPATAQWVVS